MRSRPGAGRPRSGAQGPRTPLHVETAQRALLMLERIRSSAPTRPRGGPEISETAVVSPLAYGVCMNISDINRLRLPQTVTAVCCVIYDTRLSSLVLQGRILLAQYFVDVPSNPTAI